MIRDFAKLIAAFEIDPDRRFVTAEPWRSSPYGLYELPLDSGIHPLLDMIERDNPADTALKNIIIRRNSGSPAEVARLPLY